MSCPWITSIDSLLLNAHKKFRSDFLDSVTQIYSHNFQSARTISMRFRYNFLRVLYWNLGSTSLLKRNLLVGLYFVFFT